MNKRRTKKALKKFFDGEKITQNEEKAVYKELGRAFRALGKFGERLKEVHNES